MTKIKEYPDQFDLNINNYNHITMITIVLRYLEWLMDTGLEETNEIVELEYIDIAKRFDPERMRVLVESIESKMK